MAKSLPQLCYLIYSVWSTLIETLRQTLALILARINLTSSKQYHSISSLSWLSLKLMHFYPNYGMTLQPVSQINGSFYSNTSVFTFNNYSFSNKTHFTCEYINLLLSQVTLMISTNTPTGKLMHDNTKSILPICSLFSLRKEIYGIFSTFITHSDLHNYTPQRYFSN